MFKKIKKNNTQKKECIEKEECIKNRAIFYIKYLVIIITLISIIIIFLEFFIHFYFFDRLVDKVYRKNYKEKITDAKKLLGIQLDLIKNDFNQSIQNFYQSISKDLEIEAYLLNKNLLILAQNLYYQKKSTKEIQNIILLNIKNYALDMPQNKWIVIIDEKQNIIYCNIKKKIANDIIKKAQQNIGFFKLNTQKRKLIGYVFPFYLFNWKLYLIKKIDSNELKQKTITYVFDKLFNISVVNIVFYDPEDDTFLYNSKNLSPEIQDFIKNATNEREKYIKPFLVKVKINKKLDIKYAAFINLDKFMLNFVENFKKDKRQFEKQFVILLALTLFTLGMGYLIILIFINYIGKSIVNLNKRLVQALDNQRVFLATISHEIRTPLNSIIGFLQLLYNSDLDKSQKEYVEKSLISANHLLGLIEEILDTAKIQAGEVEFTEELLDLNEIINEIVVVLSSKVREEVELKLNIPDFPYYVVGDKKRIKQIFLNIISNALKFTLKGYVEIGCKDVKELPEGKIEFLFYVRDTGIGIPKEKQDLLFKPFSQVKSEVHKEVSGTGLGLFISKKLAQLMGGNIWFESEEGKGTTFYIKLVLKKGKEKEERKEKEEKIVEKLKVEKEELRELQVLVAEDIPTNQLLIREILGKMFGIKKVDIADNGEKAVELAMGGNYDLILMDIKMPKMNGFKATEEIRRRGLKVPIYILTADVYKEIQIQAKRAGADGFLQKPIEINKLGEVLKKVVREKQRERKNSGEGEAV